MLNSCCELVSKHLAPGSQCCGRSHWCHWRICLEQSPGLRFDWTMNQGIPRLWDVDVMEYEWIWFVYHGPVQLEDHFKSGQTSTMHEFCIWMLESLILEGLAESNMEPTQHEPTKTVPSKISLSDWINWIIDEVGIKAPPIPIIPGWDPRGNFILLQLNTWCKM